ncbi:hypothetical protein QR680_016074 [Steinernema hermaphroditum]|uniref:Unconventional myosin heavy chain 6 n=1 Tax=Steinernema hermaphroditum TaxID=289476 RepID=A0AA39H9Z1_9BILA|nr:hypothetical protein QR680_016074 [Steinernema hermaphroditum]
MVLITKGDFIWIEPISKSPFATPLGARVVSADGGRILAIDDDDNEQWIGQDRRVKLMHPTSVQSVEDMIQLGDLHEAGILRNLFVRYSEKIIYTYTGSILVAVNPYRDLPIYTSEMVRHYRNRKIGELPPHIFAIADNAYRCMRENRKNQCIIISGESGAGKTESTKLVLQFLAAVSGQHSWIEQQVLEANPIMEAFGNAKTVRNDNSSRFGKYIDIHFNAAGAIEGARIEQYLLEKSRIVLQSPGERNYHIFYCMLEGLSSSERAQLELGHAKDYFYLTQGKTLTADGRDDAADMSTIRSSLKVLLFKDAEIWSIFKILAALLHIGNIKYSATTVHNMEATEIVDRLGISRVAKLLQVDERSLVNALTTRTLVTREERVVSCLSAAQSLDVRDALVKGIYGRLFIHIVNRINDAIYRPHKTDPRGRWSIGVLDIFGFENLQHNSFEQLCINYANEHLQQFFVRHVFKMEQKEYDLEKITWHHIEFTDNQEALDMIAQKPLNVMSLIDEESIFPKGTDQTMLNKLHSTHSKNTKLYSKPKSDLNKSFAVTHFAGSVSYNAKGFLEKNRDTFGYDLYYLIANSKFKFLVNLFDDVDSMDSNNRRSKQTVGSQFRKSLDVLMTQLDTCEPFFIRCIKPNDFKAAMKFDRDLVHRQLRYSGMLETIRVRKAGYPIRHGYLEFVERYRHLVPGIKPAHKVDIFSAAKKICTVVLGQTADYQLGKTKIFLKDRDDLYLEQEHDRMLTHHAVMIQKTVRGWYQRRQYERIKAAVVIVQKYWRGYAQRQRYRRLLTGFARLQAVIKSRALVAKYQRLRYIVTEFQACCRGSLIRAELRAKRARGERRAAMMAVEESDSSRPTSTINGSLNGDELDDSKLVEQIFGFLPSDTSTDTISSTVNRFSDMKLGASAASTSSPTPPPSEKDLDEDLSGYQFGKFAATYFQGHVSAQHIKKTLRQPLLHHESAGDQMASMAVWITILRFMGDLPDPKYGGDAITDKTPVMTRLYSTLGKNFSKRDVDNMSQMGQYDTYSTSKIRKNSVGKLISMTLKKKSKLNGLAEDSESSNSGGYGCMLENRPTTNLDKLHFIIGHGILREDLRDEIYCQICKQLTQNPSKNSYARGWILMSLCVGCFAPSDRFIKYLYHFIRQNGPSGAIEYNNYIEQRLRRTVKNGTRHQPPSYVELQATKSKKPIVLAVTLMDGTVKTLNADSATTAKELCDGVAKKVGLKEPFGFSVYIALFDKVSSLGSGNDHVMDAVSQCEQYAKEQGRQERNAPWRLFFRKEIFTPWHDPRTDTTSTHLIYQQVVRGVKFGEYRCDKESDLAMLAAQQFFIEQKGAPLNVERLEVSIPSYLPDHELAKKNGSMERWLQLIMHTYRKKLLNDERNLIPELVKEDVVSYAKFKWPLLFSRFYEAYKFAGPPLPKNEVIIAVNWTGIYVVDDQEQVLLEFSYPEVTGITCTQTKRLGTDSFTILTVSNDEYTFQSPNSDDIRDLIVYFLDGLKKRSKYLAAMQDYRAGDQSTYLEFRKGDLLILADDLVGSQVDSMQFVKAECVRTGLTGNVPTESVYVLPTMMKPTVDVMELFAQQPDVSVSEKPNNMLALITNPLADRPYTLEVFAADNFRQMKRSLSINGMHRHHELWKHSREPIKTSLLKKLDGKEEPCQDSVVMFLNVMKYMGDHPVRRSKSIVELTDQIFKIPLKYEILRDELYCQLMKQLTENPNRISDDRGWELMWLCVGLFPPSQGLLKHVQQFLRSRHLPIALDCLNRLQKTLRAGSRKYPPHQVEVEAIQRKTTQIFHKAFFPDNTDEAIEVESSTKAKDFCNKISNRLGLSSPDGFSLFVKISEKVISVPENEFFFDFVRQLSDWVRTNRPQREGQVAVFTYQVFFMRKLWLTVNPGEDRNADVIFHYHQELPKYLRGYHSCSRKDATEIAALILRAQTRDGKQPPFHQLQALLGDVLPRDMVKQQSVSEWKKQITNAFVFVQNLPSEEAQIEFLKRLAAWPTFGSAFFEVKQTSDANLPDKILIAINKTGVNLYHMDTKENLANYPFNVISNWTSGNTYFHMTVGNLMKARRLLFETTLGYKMDDLLTSYIKALLSSSKRRDEDHEMEII